MTCDKYCYKCHSKLKEDYKIKGDINLATHADILKSIDSYDEPIVKAGNPDESSFFFLTAIDPNDDPDDAIMPPAKKGGPLTKDEQDVLNRWIAQGAKDN